MEKGKQSHSSKKTESNRKYLISKRILKKAIPSSVALSISIAWLFYNSPLALVLFPLELLFCYRIIQNMQRDNALAKFDGEFKELLIALSSALESGYSIENAFRDAEDTTRELFGNKSVILNDIVEMNRKIAMRIPAERAFSEFANKHPTEESIGFAGVFSFARRLGGGYVSNIRRTVEKMEEKIELKQDIRGSIAEKRMEFNVMCFMPLGILTYVRLTSKDFISNLYGNITGVVMMSICIAIYTLVVLVGKRIVDIKV